MVNEVTTGAVTRRSGVTAMNPASPDGLPRILPGLPDFIAGSGTYADGQRPAAVRLQRSLDWPRVAGLESKYRLDFVLAALSLFLLSPLLILVAVTIRLDSKGPILFKQTRTGLNGKTFRIYKFR